MKERLLSFNNLSKILEQQKKLKYNQYFIEETKKYGDGINRKLLMTEEQNKLYEGLIRSTDEYEFAKKLNKSFPEAKIEIAHDNKNNTASIIKVEINKNLFENEKENFAKIGNVYGWYISSYNLIDDNLLYIEFKPRFGKEITKSIYEHYNGIIYHVTETKFVNRILKNGLCPKHDDNKLTVHDDRVYFSLSLKDSLIIQKRLSEFQKEGNVILKINLNKLYQFNSKPKFFFDPYANNAVYTLDNIPPYTIEIIN